MTKKISLLTLMLISAFTSKAATLSEKIDSFFKPIVENYLVPVIFWDPIKANTVPISIKLSKIIINAVPTYKAAINGTIFSVTLAIDLIPPIITAPTKIDNIRPNIGPFPANAGN